MAEGMPASLQETLRLWQPANDALGRLRSESLPSECQDYITEIQDVLDQLADRKYEAVATRLSENDSLRKVSAMGRIARTNPSISAEISCIEKNIQAILTNHGHHIENPFDFGLEDEN
jgi:hypothetical protein